MLGMNVDTFTIEKMFLELDPNFEKLRDLKEDYIEFNNQEYESEFDVLTNLNALINKYKYSDQSIFSDFALFLIKNKEPIVNSFIKVKVYRKSARNEQEYGSLTLAHSRNSQMSFMYGFFFVKFLFFTVVCVVIVI